MIFIRCSSFLAILLVASLLSRAQSTQPSTRPSPSAIETDAILNRMLKNSPSTNKPLQPTVNAPAIDATTGMGAVGPGSPALPLVREETYIINRVGRLTKTKDGQQWEFTFDADGATLHDPPMLLLPNTKLMAMEATLTTETRDVRFRVTGMVTEYHDRNHLLVEKFVKLMDNP